MRGLLSGWMVVLASLPVAVIAEDEDVPDLEFLEYLGSWQEQDEEWFLESEIVEQEDQAREKRKREKDENR